MQDPVSFGTLTPLQKLRAVLAQADLDRGLTFDKLLEYAEVKLTDIPDIEQEKLLLDLKGVAYVKDEGGVIKYSIPKEKRAEVFTKLGISEREVASQIVSVLRAKVRPKGEGITHKDIGEPISRSEIKG
jgi:hypothetical protein